jgi:hypothetical protein
MSETRRLKIKFGDAEFEADVPESNVQPMYDRFLSILEGQRISLLRQLTRTNGQASEKSPEPNRVDRVGFADIHDEISEPNLRRIFYLSSDGTVLLRMLPKSPGENADTLMLLLYGYYQLKKEEPVLATELIRAADRSGISLHRLSTAYKINNRYIVRGGQRKGSHYSLSPEGRQVATEIMAALSERTTSPPTVDASAAAP